MFDLAAATVRVGGKVQHLKKIAAVFLDESAKLLAEMRQAIADGEAQKLKRAAHSFKGAVGLFGAAGAMQAAQQLEKIGCSGDLTGAEDVYAKMEHEMKRLQPALTGLIKSSPP